MPGAVLKAALLTRVPALVEILLRGELVFGAALCVAVATLRAVLLSTCCTELPTFVAQGI